MRLSRIGLELCCFTQMVSQSGTKNMKIMPGGTGLFGDSSSSQSAIIVPQPESNTIYHIFTVAGLESGETIENDLEKLRGLNFYTVDLEVGANGSVVSHGNNGQPLLIPNAEKITGSTCIRL